MKLPESLVRVCPMNILIADIGGSLAVLQFDRQQQDVNMQNLNMEDVNMEEVIMGRICNVWIRKDYGSANSWTRMYTVSVDGGVQLVLGIRANGGLLVSTRKGLLVSYDPISQETIDLGIQEMEEAFYAQHYTESLVLLDKDSHSASYGGATKTKKKRKKNQRFTNSSQDKDEDQSLILVSESDSNKWTGARSARSSL
ncbi:hypothetical protein JCGZ_12235 [Jatropha curcas]|uniref:Uncharacterized protein n=2 Tax=Jatropha curcas TaxID=180498 RepID=A0A067KIY3_JATCU|nr:hypothetical protein JCGZ_12235 [Jatropha curcas]